MQPSPGGHDRAEQRDMGVAEPDAVTAAEWLVDRVSRLAPGLHLESRIQAGGGQYLVVLTS